jgi:hypothetical protein
MDTRNSVQRIVTFVLIAACPSALYGLPVRTYTAEFDLRIPANPDDSKGWMTDAVIDITDHFTIHDLDVQLNVTHKGIRFANLPEKLSRFNHLPEYVQF